MDEQFPRGVELVTGAIIENSQGEILVTRSPKWADKWTFPGGHIEPGEKIGEAIIREGEEETGLLLELAAIFNWGELINSKDFHRPAHFVYFDGYCKVTGGTIKLDERELSSWQWMKPEEALKLDFADSFKDSLEKFIAYKTRK